jgi:uncharacterized phage infection (PIP) family protein YhgE
MSHQVVQAPSIEETAAKIQEQMAQVDSSEFAPEPNVVAAPAVEESPAPEAEEAPKVEEPEQVEEAAEEPSKSQEIDDALSARFSKIAEREREFRQVEQRLADQEERIEARLAELEARENKLANPDHLLEVLEGLNMTPDEFQKRMLLGQIQLEKPEVDPVQQKLNELDERTRQVEEMRQEIILQRQQQAEKDLENQYLSQVKDAATRYENLSEYFDGDMEEIVRVAHQQAELYASEYNEAPEIEDLLSQLDTYYGGHLDRFRKKWDKPSSEQAPAPKKKASRTLKGSDTQTAATTSAGGWTAQDVATGKISFDQWQEQVMRRLNHK